MRDTKDIEIITSPLQCAGKKTRSIRTILSYVPFEEYDRWLEPFAGSCEVGITEQPERAIFSDITPYPMQFLQALRKREISPEYVYDAVTNFAQAMQKDVSVYYAMRKRFAESRRYMDYFLLTYFCRNGIVEFTKKGACTTSPGKIRTKKIDDLLFVLQNLVDSMQPDWQFSIAPFEVIFAGAQPNDILYADPPRISHKRFGLSLWTMADAAKLRFHCATAPCTCMVSLWYTRNGETNPEIALWQKEGFTVHSYLVYTGRGYGLDALCIKVR